MKEVMSFGEGGGGVAVGSAKMDCRGAFEEARVRAKVWRRDANPRAFVGDVDEGGLGEGGRLPPLGVFGVPFFGATPFATGVFFLPPPNVRRNDHSDSNSTDSNSFERGV